MNSIPSMVIKTKSEADKYETVESRRLGDMYCSASLRMDSLTTYDTLHDISLKKVGITDLESIQYYMDNPGEIPQKYMDEIVASERDIFLSKFEEKNNYYRMLIGLPAMEAEPIYIDYYTLVDYGFVEPYEDWHLTNNIPLHMLPDAVLEAMDTGGYLEELQKLYPEEKYISYLGLRKVDLAIARMSGNFALLYFPKIEGASRFSRDFAMHYDEAREYFLSTVYNFSYSSRYENYDGMIGFMILHMAIQRMISSTFKVMLDRDFYDMETCRVFLESYKIPFLTQFTLNQQKMIIKNLNLLLMNKHSAHVLYDVLDLLGYNNIGITKYLLVKQHKLYQHDVESDLTPSFSYKFMLDDSGNQYLTVNNSMMYDYYFAGVDMLSSDVHLENITAANTFGYDEFTNDDALWIHDDELVEKLENAEINYVETKYANIAVTFRMQEKTFELIYLSRLILDKKNETSRIMIDVPLIVDTPQSLFDIQVLLICMLCKRNHMIPDLLKTPSKILYILGFNFEADLEAIKKETEDNPLIYDSKICRYLKDIVFVEPEDVNRMYVNVRDLESFLANAMQETASLDTYYAYKKLYDTILYTKLNNSLYSLSDGTEPDRFDQYLEDQNPLLYEFLQNVSEDDVGDYIDYVATKFSTMFPDTEYMSYLAPMDIYLIDAMLKMLRAFKSYTIDIRNIDVIYRFDSRYHNLLKFIVDPTFVERLYPVEAPLKYSDWVDKIRGTMEYKEIENTLYELQSMSSNILANGGLVDFAETYYMYCSMTGRDILKMGYGDMLMDNKSTIRPDTDLTIDDAIHTVETISCKDNLMTDKKYLKFVVDGEEHSPQIIK